MQADDLLAGFLRRTRNGAGELTKRGREPSVLGATLRSAAARSTDISKNRALLIETACRDHQAAFIVGIRAQQLLVHVTGNEGKVASYSASASLNEYDALKAVQRAHRPNVIRFSAV